MVHLQMLGLALSHLCPCRLLLMALNDIEICAKGLLCMVQGSTQDHWMHAVPKRAKCLGPRINLTFRRIVHLERV